MMKKVGIITCGKEPNYGACLQAFATLHAIKDMGYNAELMNYSFGADKFYSPFNQPTLKSSIIATLFYFPRKSQWLSFEKFRQQNMSYSSKRLYNCSDFEEVKKDYSCFVTGSDQVWNPELGIDVNITLQSFIHDGDAIRRISYASSFGSSSLKKKYIDLYTRELEKFSAISVREASGATLINKMLHRDICSTVCDPVMLFDEHFWKKYMDNSKTPTDKYIVIYDMRHSSEVMNCARSLAKARGCKIIAMSRVKLLKKGIQFVTNLSPSQFLSYMYNAEAVVTDSFHGTVFSILFHKEFYSFVSGNGVKIGERLLHLLDVLNLKNRLYSKFDKTMEFTPINYSSIDPIVSDFRDRSFNYLKKALNGLQ